MVEEGTSAEVSTCGAAFTPKEMRGVCVTAWPSATSLTQRSALLVASSTAVEVTVAPDSFSKLPPFTASRPTNWSRKLCSCARVPMPALSAKEVSPTTHPVTRPSWPTPSVTATGPP